MHPVKRIQPGDVFRVPVDSHAILVATPAYFFPDVGSFALVLAPAPSTIDSMWWLLASCSSVPRVGYACEWMFSEPGWWLPVDVDSEEGS